MSFKKLGEITVDEVVTENSNNLISSNAVYDYTKDDLTYTDETVAPDGVNPIASLISNPNLLINGDFSVNQRGGATYSTSGYTVDRWRLYQASNVCVVTPRTTGGISINNSSGTTFATFRQYVEDYQVLAGKTITVSCKVNSVSGNVRIYIEGLKSTIQYSSLLTVGYNSITITCNSSVSTTQIGFNLAQGVSIDVDYMKLELGSVATSFSPQPYAKELTMCKRYYQKITSSYQYGIISSGMQSSTTTANIAVPIGIEMRISPTLTLSDVSHFRVHCGYTLFKVPSAITKYSYQQNGLVLTATYEAVSTNDNPVDLGFNNTSGYIALDAEIY